MAPATSTGPAFDVQGLQTLNAKADVALDIFLDSERALANSTTNAAYEMMVWFGTIGGAEPIGYFESQSHGDYTLGQTKLYVIPILSSFLSNHQTNIQLVLSILAQITTASMSIPG